MTDLHAIVNRWAALPQRADPVEPPLQWATADDENAARADAEERAYALMAAHDPLWIEWLLNCRDGGETIKLLSLYMRGNDVSADKFCERLDTAVNIRAAFVDYIEGMQ